MQTKDKEIKIRVKFDGEIVSGDNIMGVVANSKNGSVDFLIAGNLGLNELIELQEYLNKKINEFIEDNLKTLILKSLKNGHLEVTDCEDCKKDCNDDIKRIKSDIVRMAKLKMNVN